MMILPICLTACAEPRTEYVPVKPEIAADLLTPCAISDRQAKTYRDLAVLATEHLGSAHCANGKIEAIGKSLGPV
ncbi:Rz1-like lysis system protein LysC [Pseudosulfitobacter pseudonitzschiae]|uniref:Rz1-like lysis system protein LysC n=2 Tax=Pseudosulfitobacter pseudonitzschiae TaxID=1402135 RepID=UPI001CCB933C|nr:hypothetical protein [Pseudosulfitobacter pseudonitzschiae]MCA0137687.1 hypothetical protein [Pseudosulfitobacter pseudonitzschiae]MCD2329273.1 hypothetical protein [Pseudosulfitobacter pseudonitzschiae]UFE30657.1 hypothetical protein LOE41_16790 [Pseudosulfitobacter pseudonitzschiae]UFE34790.1 hypothetical protein LOE40_07060 [Pseudosulfitobacter pseudonitzschiae]UFE36765.1 hypothetical protein LOE39_12755 [Pseudosulfitobacter pseudonitzschiae]